MIKVIENILSQDQCTEAIKYIDSVSNKFIQSIVYNKVLAKKYRDIIQDKFLDYVIGDHVTITKRLNSVPKHKDKEYKDFPYDTKLALYLNNAPGTVFILPDKEFVVQGIQGSGVLFDINIEHYGSKSSGKDYKYLLGFRLNKIK